MLRKGGAAPTAEPLSPCVLLPARGADVTFHDVLPLGKRNPRKPGEQRCLPPFNTPSGLGEIPLAARGRQARFDHAQRLAEDPAPPPRWANQQVAFRVILPCVNSYYYATSARTEPGYLPSPPNRWGDDDHAE